MTIINIALLRICQGLAGIFFVFIISAYFGLLLLLPLAILYHLSNALTDLFSFNGVGGVLIALPIAGALLYQSYKIPGLLNNLSETGLSLIKLAKQQVMNFEDLIRQQRGFTGSIHGNSAV